MAEILVVVSLVVYVAMIMLVVATVAILYKRYSHNMANACLLNDRLPIEDSLPPKMYGIKVLKSAKRWQNKRR
jgi:hypothetical protein